MEALIYTTSLAQISKKILTSEKKNIEKTHTKIEHFIVSRNSNDHNIQTLKKMANTTCGNHLLAQTTTYQLNGKKNIHVPSNTNPIRGN